MRLEAKEDGVIRCDRCGKLMAAKGIRLQVMEQGEYQVQYFACIHCGARYQTTTTDAEQRRLIEARLAALEKRAIAMRRKFRQKTIARHWKDAEKLKKEIEQRAGRLREIGNEVLHPKGGGEDGSENGKSGTHEI